MPTSILGTRSSSRSLLSSTMTLSHATTNGTVKRSSSNSSAMKVDLSETQTLKRPTRQSLRQVGSYSSDDDKENTKQDANTAVSEHTLRKHRKSLMLTTEDDLLSMLGSPAAVKKPDATKQVTPIADKMTDAYPATKHSKRTAAVAADDELQPRAKRQKKSEEVREAKPTAAVVASPVKCITPPKSSLKRTRSNPVATSASPPTASLSVAALPIVKAASPVKPSQPLIERLSVFEQLELLHQACHLSAITTQSVVPAGRTTEHQHILQFADQCIKQQVGGSMYICGSPGTGKTHTMDLILQHYFGINIKQREALNANADSNRVAATMGPAPYAKTCQSVYMNCMTHSSSQSNASKQSSLDVLCQLLQQLTGKSYNKQTVYDDFVDYVCHAKKMVVVVLDECDSLHHNNSTDSILHNLLYRLPTLPRSKLLVIGLSNNISLPSHIKQQTLGVDGVQQYGTLVFSSYTREQLLEIITTKLKAVLELPTNQPLPFIDTPALFFMCSKLASSSGDVRRCLDITRQCVEWLIQQYKEHERNGTTPAAPLRVNMPVMSKMMSNSTHSNSDTTQKIKSLPPQQQLLLSIAALHTYVTKKEYSTMLMVAKQKNVTLSAKQLKIRCTYTGLRQYFNRIKPVLHLPSYNESEFTAMCEMLSVTGLMNREDEVLQRAGSTGSARKQIPTNDASYVIHTTIAVIKDALSDNMFIQQLLTKAERSTVQWKDRLEDQTKQEIEVKQRQEVREAESDDDDENAVPDA